MSKKMFVPVAWLLLVSYPMAALTSPATAPRNEVNQNSDSAIEWQKKLATKETEFKKLNKYFEDTEKEWLRVCQEAGVKNASVIDRTAFGNAKSCIENAIEIPELINVIDELQNIGRITPLFLYIKNNCELGLKLRDCFSKFLIDIDPCIEGERAWLNGIRRLNIDFPSFLCDDKSHNIDLFIEGKGEECFETKSSNITSCARMTAREATVRKTEYRYSDLNETNSLKRWFNRRFNSVECKDISIYFQCAVKELRTCSNSKPADFVESFYKTVFIPACNITVTP